MMWYGVLLEPSGYPVAIGDPGRMFGQWNQYGDYLYVIDAESEEEAFEEALAYRVAPDYRRRDSIGFDLEYSPGPMV